MRLAIVFLLITLASCDNWAVLVAGSHTWSNYRHQADVYHAYQVLIKGGYDPNRIITLAYDDIANHFTNPFKGKVFNHPTYKDPGVDVYEGVKIDYSKGDVTPEVFQAVLEGNKDFVAKKGTGRVLESNSADNVFIFFSDHGATGLIAFPTKTLYADHLLATFAKMQGKYNRLVFYLEVRLCLYRLVSQDLCSKNYRTILKFMLYLLPILLNLLGAAIAHQTML